MPLVPLLEHKNADFVLVRGARQLSEVASVSDLAHRGVSHRRVAHHGLAHVDWRTVDWRTVE